MYTNSFYDVCGIGWAKWHNWVSASHTQGEMSSVFPLHSYVATSYVFLFVRIAEAYLYL